MRLLPWWAHFW